MSETDDRGDAPGQDLTSELTAIAGNAALIAERCGQLIMTYLETSGKAAPAPPKDPLNLSKTLRDLAVSAARHPIRTATAPLGLGLRYADLWQRSVRRMAGFEVEPAISAPRDKRFRDEAWDQPAFDFSKQAYLITADWLNQTLHKIDGELDPQARFKLEFYARQFMDALAPSNFLLTNPQVLKATIDERGENLVRGLENLITDLERGNGKLAIRQTDMEAFEVGRNVATAPGKVVFQNELIQLIQYAPTTKTVYKRPLVIFPPWINKFYILDLRPENSFIRWCVAQGYTVFIVSWVNPDEKLAGKNFTDYMQDGIFAALDAIKKATGEKQVSAIGYCIGGTLLYATLALMAKTKDTRIANATFFTAQADFSEAGELSIFVDEAQLNALEETMMARGGYLDGAEMATTFNMLRANDLIWSFMVNNYLLGKAPFPFDLLYWNADSTRMPVTLHMQYLRECYLHNAIAEGQFTLAGKRVNLGDIKIPLYIQSGKDDHIAPARSVYKTARLLTGAPKRYILAGSGHIAGVVNPPSAKKYQHWTSESDALPETLDEWRETAEEHPGSWWPDWHKWLSKKSGPRVKARKPGSGKLKAIEDAPGSYVRVRADTKE